MSSIQEILSLELRAVVQAVSLAVIRYSCYKATRLDKITKGVSINRKELRELSPRKLSYSLGKEAELMKLRRWRFSGSK